MMSKSSTSDNYVCPVYASSGKCGDQDALRVMEQFKDFYEEKLNEVDVQGGGDCLELKLKIQRRWIEDLTEQTHMMARIVKELEDEATERVRMLEDKLRQTSKSAYEVMKRYQAYSISHNLDEPFQKVFYLENDIKNLLEFVRRVREDKRWSIDGLTFYDVSYRDLFGKEPYGCDDKNPDNVASNDGIDDKKEEASKNYVESDQTDLAEQLKRKTQEFEEFRRTMLDMRSALTEEVACKHDMISALKKDIQQLEERCVQSDKQTAFKDDIIKELRKEIKQLKQQNREKEAELTRELEEMRVKVKRMKPCVETTTVCTDTDDKTSAWRKGKSLEEEICKRQCEVEQLKCKCAELEKTLSCSQGRAENLQKAIEQQKVTISNLQEALVNVKHELDELKQNNQQEVEDCQYLCNVFYVNLLDLEERTKNISDEFSCLKEAYKRLQECNLELEVEHFNALQDLTILETQLYKFQNEFRNAEDAKNAARSELKHLRRQNRYYEQVVDCFKHEMAVMSEQLVHLHEMLNLSNKSCREENGQLYNAVVELQKLAEKLQTDLVNTEKKVLIENQKNQMKDAKIGELQQIIGQKNADLNVHDEAINEMKMRLENALLENHELQSTIVALNSSIMQLELRLQNSNVEKAQKIVKSKAITCKKSFSDCTDSCERKFLRAESTDQREIVRGLQRELEKVKEKNKEKIRNLKRQNEDLKDKLATSELAAERLCAQICQLKEKVANLNETDCCRDQELMRSKQIIIELRQTLIELNESLAESELDVTLPEEYQRSRRHDSESGGEDIYQSCRCEIAQYKKLTDRLKNTILNMKNKLKDLEFKNKTLREELKGKDTKVNDIYKKTTKKEKEWCQCIEELNEKLRESQEEEKRLTAFIDNLKAEVQKRIEEKKDMHQQEWLECNCTPNDIASTQQEINCLKVEIKNMIQNQIALNKENDRLLKQVTYLQTRITELEEKNMQLKQKVEKLHSENKSYKEKNKNLSRDKETLNHTIKCLEVELCEIKNVRDDLCAESKCVVNNVKAWLEEQRKVNEKVRKKTQCYCNTINKLKQENETLIIGRPLANSTAISNNKPRYEKNFKYDQNCWCLDSQGSGSGMNSPRDSPTCSCSVEEWYSPTFKDEEETDEEDNFIHALEAITEEIRKNNRKWKGRCQECPDEEDQ